MDQKLTWMHQVFEQQQSDQYPMIQNEEEKSPSRKVVKMSSNINQLKTKSSKIYEETKTSFVRQSTGQLMPKVTEGEGGGSPKRQNSLKKKATNQEHIKKMREEQHLKLNKGEEIRVKEDEDWKEEEFKVAKSRIYIREYRSSPVELVLSLINRVSIDQEEESAGIIKTISSLGLLISSIDEAPIQLNALIIENVFGEYYDIINQIRKHHTEKLLQNALKFIGASNLIGNPVNLVNALGTGIQDFYYQPIQGFLHGGVLEGGMGIITGTSSLMKNTLIGTMGSVSKISSSWSKGLLVLSNDKNYIYQRDIDTIKQKPKNVLQGLGLGFKSAINSIGSGVTGLVTKPMEGGDKGGILGFFKGAAQGVAGIVVKPISGTLDFISITSEGIKNTTKSHQELQSDKRLRLPRPFYEEEKTIRDFDEFHAFWINLVPRLSKEIPCDNLYEACLLDCTEFSWSVLFFTVDNIALIVPVQLQNQQAQQQQSKHTRMPVIKWVYQTKDLKYIEVFDQKYLTFGFQNSSINLLIGDPNVTERIKNKLNKIIKHHH